MELRQLQYFVTLAEELHFGRAAAREHIVQSSLSQQLQRLERDLGVTLVDRNTHQVRLSAAGAAFLLEARQILAHVERAVVVAQRAARSTPTLRVGIVDASYDSMALILHDVQRQYPGSGDPSGRGGCTRAVRAAHRRQPGCGPRPGLAGPTRGRLGAVPAGPARGAGLPRSTGSPRTTWCRWPRWPPNRCCSPRRNGHRNSISSSPSCADRWVSSRPCTGAVCRASRAPSTW